jgi:hypothetical protein
MNKAPFKSGELKQNPTSSVPKFKNTDDEAVGKVLVSKDVAKKALSAVFRNRPAYFTQKP